MSQEQHGSRRSLTATWPCIRILCPPVLHRATACHGRAVVGDCNRQQCGECSQVQSSDLLLHGTWQLGRRFLPSANLRDDVGGRRARPALGFGEEPNVAPTALSDHLRPPLSLVLWFFRAQRAPVGGPAEGPIQMPSFGAETMRQATIRRCFQYIPTCEAVPCIILHPALHLPTSLLLERQPTMSKPVASPSSATADRGAGASGKSPAFTPLGRVHSHRDEYDADTGAVEGEFALFSRHHLNSDHTRPRSKSTADKDAVRPLQVKRAKTQSHATRQPSALPNATSPEHGDGPIAHFEHEVEDYEKRDVQIEREEQNELERIRSGGHSGQSSVASTHGRDLEKGPDSPASGTDSTSSTSSAAPEKDPDLVTWDSPDSQENPRNWTSRHKRIVVTIVSSYTFLSPLTSSIVAPALPLLSRQFGLTSSVRETMLLSSFILGYACGPRE